MNAKTVTRTAEDLKVRHDVQSELGWQPGLTDPAHIGVAVDGGVVTLSGEVGSLSQRAAAVMAAQRVVGVLAVNDELRLRPILSEPSGLELAKAVNDVLRWTSGIPEDRIHLEVQGHSVILSGLVDWNYQRTAAVKAVRRIDGGSVRSWIEKHEAESTAWSSPNVTQVHNALVVHLGNG